MFVLLLVTTIVTLNIKKKNNETTEVLKSGPISADNELQPSTPSSLTGRKVRSEDPEDRLKE